MMVDRKGYPEEKGTERESLSGLSRLCFGIARAIPRKRELKALNSALDALTNEEIARAIPRKRELKASGCSAFQRIRG